MAIPQAIRIFVSSPGDVLEEREIVFRTIERFYRYYLKDDVFLQVIAWDHPNSRVPLYAAAKPQDTLNREMAKASECDIVIVLLWSRMGTPLQERKPDGTFFASGTEYEFYDALNAFVQSERQIPEHGRPQIVIYRRTDPPAIYPTNPKWEEIGTQWRAVDSFVKYVKQQIGSVIEYKTVNEFQDKFDTDLQYMIKKAIVTD